MRCCSCIYLETENLFTFDNAENITIDGITMCGTRTDAVNGTGNNLTVKNCTIKNIAGTAIELEGNKILIENNEITATGKAGVILTGGDREALRSSENVVTNKLIAQGRYTDAVDEVIIKFAK